MEGRETGSAGTGIYLINQYVKIIFLFLKAPQAFTKVPAAFLNAKRNQNLPDSENIWAFIEGSEKPNEVLVISAHYDHVGVKMEISITADDDGSGTVALLEIAEAFQRLKKQVTDLNVRSCFTCDRRKHGLLGSSYYSENLLFPMANTITDINIDMRSSR
jgi:Zn-dependent M28 family amino/carboxypeptidase